MSSELSREPVSEEILTDHSYDGIQEYDNPLPGWWKFLFWLFIVIAPFYLFYFHFGVESRSVHSQYEREMASIFELKFKEIGVLEPTRETLLKYMKDEEWLSVGKVVFKANCVNCHGPDGGGLVGPNLTDDSWKGKVRNVEDIYTVINEGAANGAMPAWKNRLSNQNQRVLTAAYVASLRGTTPKSPKAPEGNEIPGWEE